MDPGRGAGGSALRSHNMALLLRLITDEPGCSRAALAGRTGLTKATVSTLTAELIESGLVHETVRGGTDRPGRPATSLAPDPLGPVGIGLSLRAGKAVGYLADLGGRVLARETRGIEGSEPRLARPVLRKLFDTATSAGRSVAGVTLAAPPGRHGPELDARLRAELAELGAPGIEAASGDELRYAAQAQARAHGSERLLYLGGETVLGAALLPEGSSGDLTHVPVRPRGEPCPCGARGCLGRYVDPASVRERTGHAIEALSIALAPMLALTGWPPVLLGGWLRAVPASTVGWRLGAQVHTARLGTEASLVGACTAALAHIREDPASWLAQWS
ncbi:winged helix-turn-helix domain-containing protein [Sciscionella marina]|uniref:winged helix-turn-helix domain-containing protein n=1 Tax=Sciscionella marina TaxID=508770 RepID=UPI00037833F5|nr:winged helix-turn-helix domain-containing protein [Sciscionella marina]